MLYAVAFIGGLLIGGLLMKLLKKEPPKAGMLYFYTDEPGNDPIMMAELNQPVEAVRKQTQVIFGVSHK